MTAERDTETVDRLILKVPAWLQVTIILFTISTTAGGMLAWSDLKASIARVEMKEDANTIMNRAQDNRIQEVEKNDKKQDIVLARVTSTLRVSGSWD